MFAGKVLILSIFPLESIIISLPSINELWRESFVFYLEQTIWKVYRHAEGGTQNRVKYASADIQTDMEEMCL